MPPAAMAVPSAAGICALSAAAARNRRAATAAAAGHDRRSLREAAPTGRSLNCEDVTRTVISQSRSRADDVREAAARTPARRGAALAIHCRRLTIHCDDLPYITPVILPGMTVMRQGNEW